jgi:hypothetical protein
MRPIILGGLAAALSLSTIFSLDGPAAAASAVISTMPESAICKEASPPVGLRCKPPVARTTESFKGRDVAEAIGAFGTPERMRDLSSGARVLVWDRSGIAIAEGGRVVKQDECHLQMAVVRSGIVADALLTSESRSCARRFGLAG